MPKKVLMVVGTRPNLIKITRMEEVMARYGDAFDYRLCHTGQHYDDRLSKVFFEQLELRQPDYYLGVSESHPARLIARIVAELTTILTDWQPDWVIAPGDVNSTLGAALAANKCGVKLAHLESGLRSFDRSMPEEHNRVVTDALADLHWVTEPSGQQHLSTAGVEASGVHFVGNTMIDTLVKFDVQIEASTILQKLQLTAGDYVLMTLHRPGNVDTKAALAGLLDLVDHLTEKRPVVFPIHPRTRQRLQAFGLEPRVVNNSRLIETPPMDYFSFQKLVAKAHFVFTDSGGIQEETTFRRVPCLTFRPNTERPITVTVGTNTLVDSLEEVVRLAADIEAGTYKKGAIPELWDGKATDRLVEVLHQMP